MATSVTIGLENCLADPPAALRQARLGLLMNQASVDRHYQYAHHLLAHRLPGQLHVLFSPQHGMWSQQQDNMIETPHSIEPQLQLPVYSLYADRRKPTAQMLGEIDCLVVDLQDVGTRVYTFIWTLMYCLEACAEAGVKVVILDRPNPLGGTRHEGPLLEPAFASFVGLHAIPMRHGLTMGEMARHLNRTRQIGADVLVVPMSGWRRSQHWLATGRSWLGPSPNLPRIESADVYPGTVLLEGTQLSEGRGTTTPFELLGAPFVDPARLASTLEGLNLPGVTFRPVRFEPTFQKAHGQSCGGVYLHVTARELFRPYWTTLVMLATIRNLWPSDFQWRQPPYEYEDRLLPIDILAGTDAVRTAIDAGATPAQLSTLAAPAPDWPERIAPDLLYEPPCKS